MPGFLENLRIFLRVYGLSPGLIAAATQGTSQIH